MKRPFLLFILLCSIFTYPQTGICLDIVKNSKPDAVIVTQKENLEAAKVLQSYIKKISGADLEIINSDADAATKTKIYIGAGPWLKSNHIKTDLSYGNTSLIVKNNNLFIDACGVSPVKAVYYLLEKYLGVKWLWPGKYGEVVSRKKDIVLDDKLCDIYKNPFTIYHGYLRAFSLETKAAKTKLMKDYYGSQQKAWATWQDRLQLGNDNSNRYSAPHAFRKYYKRYIKTNPEYFALTKRSPKRGDIKAAGLKDHQVKLCLSNEELSRQIIKNWLKTNSRMLNLSPNDCDIGWCICSKCKALDSQTPYKRVSYIDPTENISDRHYWFLNKMAKEAKKHRKDAMVKCLAYESYIFAPEKPLEDNIILAYCPIWKYPMRKDIHQQFLKRWDDWKKLKPKMYVRGNALDYSVPYVPYNFARDLGNDLKHFWDSGILMGIQMELVNTFHLQNINNYVVVQLMRDPTQNVDAILEEYYDGFGAAREPMKKFFEYFEQITREVDFRPGVFDANPRFAVKNFNKEVMAKGLPFITEALKCSKGKPEHERVLYMAEAYDNAIRVIDVMESGLKAAKGSGIEEHRKKYLLLVNHFEKLQKESKYKYRQFNGFTGAKDFFNTKILAKIGNNYKVVQSLPCTWDFEPDLQETGLKEKWYENKKKFSRKISILSPWEKQQWGQEYKAAHNGKDYDGYAWYKTEFKTPKDYEKSNNYILLFQGVDEKCIVWVNGKKAGEHEGWKDVFEIDVNKYLKAAGEKNIVIVRVEDKIGAGGIYKPVFFCIKKEPGLDFAEAYRNLTPENELQREGSYLKGLGIAIGSPSASASWKMKLPKTETQAKEYQITVEGYANFDSRTARLYYKYHAEDKWTELTPPLVVPRDSWGKWNIRRIFVVPAAGSGNFIFFKISGTPTSKKIFYLKRVSIKSLKKEDVL